jgi:hypothetical protein
VVDREAVDHPNLADDAAEYRCPAADLVNLGKRSR